jgi:hypothetical protein
MPYLYFYCFIIVKISAPTFLFIKAQTTEQHT